MKARPPASTGSLDAAGQAIQRTAAEWLARREAQGLSLNQQADLADWLAADPRHAAVFAEVESAWRAFDALAAYPHSEDTAANPDLLAPRRRRARRAAWIPLTLAAAAALAFGGLRWARDRAEPASAPAVAVAEPAESHFIRLSDGSLVELKSDSVVSERFTATERRVRLVRGEAYFSVTKNPAREFVVEADGVAVRALGTAFNVRVQGEAVEVLVTEGVVRVAPPSPGPSAALPPAEPRVGPEPLAATLTAGQRTRVAPGPDARYTAPRVETLAPADIERALAWQANRLNLDSIPLSEVVRRLNRFAAGSPAAPRLSVADADLGKLLISGRVRSDDMGSFVEALELSFGVAAERRADGEIILRRAGR